MERHVRSRHNYLYLKGTIKTWVDKVKQISLETSFIREYFNNHYGAKAVINAIQFKETLGSKLSRNEKAILEKCEILIFSSCKASYVE